MKKPTDHADIYTDVNTGVLLNKLGLVDRQKLELVEGNVTALRMLDLARSPVSGNFDLFHLRAIHRKLVSDIYEWAGEIRTVNISKGEPRFGHYLWIEPEAKRLFNKLKSEQYLQELGAQEFSERTGFYLGELNVLHPFRDGNGRALREFIRQLAEQAGYKIRWKGISQTDMVQASVDAYLGDHSLLSKLILKSICKQ